jgi:hypothetical protein
MSLSNIADLRHVKEPNNFMEVGLSGKIFTGHFSSILPPFANRGLSRRLAWSASGDKRGTKMGLKVQTASNKG